MSELTPLEYDAILRDARRLRAETIRELAVNLFGRLFSRRPVSSTGRS